MAHGWLRIGLTSVGIWVASLAAMPSAARAGGAEEIVCPEPCGSCADHVYVFLINGFSSCRTPTVA